MDTLKLDQSRVVRAIQSDEKIVYKKLALYSEELSDKTDIFIRSWLSKETDSTENLAELKNQGEALLRAVYLHTRGFNGRALTEQDKNHYLTIYRLRTIDREITRKLNAAGVEAVDFFRKPVEIPNGRGKWLLQIEVPHSAKLNGYYEMVRDSADIEEIVQVINEIFNFSEEHTVRFFECGEGSVPVYDRETKNINICYEQFNFIEKIFYEELRTENEISSQIMDIIGMVLLREFGRAFLDIFDVPYSGKIVDTIDQLAVVLTAEVFGENWEDIERRVMAYAKALYRIHELMETEKGYDLSTSWKLEVTREDIEKQTILVFNDFYDNSSLLGKQRFYSILAMLAGYKADIFNTYMIKNEYDAYKNTLFPEFNPAVVQQYFRSSNYWYNALYPYMRQPEKLAEGSDYDN